MSKLSVLLMLAFMIPSSYGHQDFSDLPKNKQTSQALYIDAKQAYQLKADNPDKVYFVDVRTQAEVEFLGMPTVVDANIPYFLNDVSEWDEDRARFLKTPNSNFSVILSDRLEEAGLDKQATILLMCRSGTRSARAADLLNQLGYSNAYTVVDGFEGDKIKQGVNKGKRLKNGWKNADLPWSYQLEEDKMYFE